MTPRRILVVAGARALSRTARARVWAAARIIESMERSGADTICHGACIASPDEWAGDLARIGRLTQVSWPLALGHARVWVPGDKIRNLREADEYAFSEALERNAVMARWAGDMLRAGHHVEALTLRCEWPVVDGDRATQGTASARDRLIEQLGRERVTDLVCPREHGP